MIRLSVLIMLLFAYLPVYAVNVIVTPAVTIDTSHFQVGVTHVQSNWQNGNATAVARMKGLLTDGRIELQNIHIMGWGPGNPEPSPGVYDWSTLDSRINLVRSMGYAPVITFCTAPGWMKTSGNDWDMEDRPKDEYFDEFAGLCRAVAQRYPDVRYFQVWNELKGFWNATLNNWDYTKFTAMYNMVWDSVKTARPDALLGGPYIVMQGTGSRELGYNGPDTYAPIRSQDRTFITNFLANCHGTDFITFDWGIKDYHDTNTYTETDQMRLTHWMRDIGIQLRTMTTKPIWVSEYYGGRAGDDFTAANHASCYRNSLLGDMSVGLHWDPVGFGPLFTPTTDAAGGQALPHYYVVKDFNTYFGPGTIIVQSSSSDSFVDVLASIAKIMLINKHNNTVQVSVNGAAEVSLAAYEVRVIDMPGTTVVSNKDPLERPSADVHQTVSVREYDLQGRRATFLSTGIHYIRFSNGNRGLKLRTR